MVWLKKPEFRFLWNLNFFVQLVQKPASGLHEGDKGYGTEKRDERKQDGHHAR